MVRRSEVLEGPGGMWERRPDGSSVAGSVACPLEQSAVLSGGDRKQRWTDQQLDLTSWLLVALYCDPLTLTPIVPLLVFIWD